MSNQWIDPESCPTLAVLVETVTAPLLIQHDAPVCLEMGIQDAVKIPADPVQTAELIRALVTQALDEMPSGGDLTINVHQSFGVTELEVIDSGCDVSQRARRIPMVAAAMGASLDWQQGPQGGAVVKIVFPRGASGRMAA